MEARQLRKVIATFRGTVVTQKGAPSPVQWHEQACEHFGLRGLVRIAVRGLVVEVRWPCPLPQAGLEVELISRGLRPCTLSTADVTDIEAAGGYPCCIIRRRGHGSTRLPQVCVTSGAVLGFRIWVSVFRKYGLRNMEYGIESVPLVLICVL